MFMEYISRKYNYLYFILMILISLSFIGVVLIIILVNIHEIILEKRISSIVFTLCYISIFMFLIRFSYIMNTIIYESETDKIIIKKLFFKKYFKLNEIQKVDRFILPYLNYIKIGGKSYFFISRTVDPFGQHFNFDFEKDLKEIRNLLKKK